MSKPKYYNDATYKASSRDEMFHYVSKLIEDNNLEGAKHAFSDLMVAENVTEPEVTAVIEVDASLPAQKRILSVMKNVASWRMVTAKGRKTPDKHPSPAGIDAIRSLKLSHADLEAYHRSLDGKQRHQSELLAYHNSWDREYMLQALMRYGTYTGIASTFARVTTDNDFLTKAISLYLGSNNSYAVRQILAGTTSRLDDETLNDLFFNKQIIELASDERITSEQLETAWREVYSDYRNADSMDRRRAFIFSMRKNPNASTRLLDATVDEDNYPPAIYDEIITHPNLSANALDKMISRNPSKDVRAVLVKHPNLSVAAIRKFAKSSYVPVAEVAVKRLEEIESRQKKKRENRF